MRSPYFILVSLLLCGPALLAQDDKAKSVALFQESLKVFRHPRCMNCHPAGENPTQGQNMHPHLMNVKRGPDDHGATALKCSACHGVENNKHSNVPGAPKWALAPKSMAWQNTSDGELCKRLKDPKRTHMDMQQFIKHNAEDELVAWGWNPGGGREPVPGTQKQFGELIAAWVASGAHCP